MKSIVEKWVKNIWRRHKDEFSKILYMIMYFATEFWWAINQIGKVEFQGPSCNFNLKYKYLKQAIKTSGGGWISKNVSR